MTPRRPAHEDLAGVPANRPLPLSARLAAAPAVGLYAWWATGLDDFTLPSLAAVLLAGLATIALASRHPSRGRPPVDAARSAPWAVLGAALAGWELLAFSLSPRSTHPTLSSIADVALRPRPMEALALAAWLWVGWRLARR